MGFHVNLGEGSIICPCSQGELLQSEVVGLPPLEEHLRGHLACGPPYRTAQIRHMAAQ